MAAVGLHRADGDADAGLLRRGDGADQLGLQADQARRRRPLKVLWWQGPTLLNPHFAIGTKDQDGSRIFYEPLAGWDPDGNLAPVLAAEIPSRENGGLAADGKSVTWKLKQGVQWHDGKPFTADDVVFNWEYAADPATAAVTIGSYKDVKVEKVDDLHGHGPVRQADAVLGRRLRRHARHDHPEAPVRGLHRARSRARRRPTSSRSAPGPTSSTTSSRATWSRGEINPNYHVAEPAVFRRHRDEGRRRRGFGGARRAADRRVRLRLEHAGRGRDPEAAGEGRQGPGRSSPQAATSSTSRSTSPIPGPRSTASARASRPSIRCCPIRRCARRSRCWSIAMSVEKYIYGRTGVATAQLPQQPGALPLEEHQMRVQHREGQRHPRQGRAGRRAPTASARRTARS